MKSKFVPIAVITLIVLLLIQLSQPAESSFEPITMYDNDGITISLQSANASSLKMRIDNMSSANIHIYGESSVINGFSFPALLIQDVYSGKTATAEIHLDSSALSVAGISNIADVSLYTHITAEQGDELYRGRIEAVIDSSYSQPIDSSGAVVYSSDDYYISARLYNIDNPCEAMLVYVENKTDNCLSLMCNSVSVNDVMLEGSFSLQNVEAHTRAQFVLDFSPIITFNEANSAAVNVSHVESIATQLQLAPWSGNTFNTADMFLSDVVTLFP